MINNSLQIGLVIFITTVTNFSPMQEYAPKHCGRGYDLFIKKICLSHFALQHSDMDIRIRMLPSEGIYLVY